MGPFLKSTHIISLSKVNTEATIIIIMASVLTFVQMVTRGCYRGFQVACPTNFGVDYTQQRENVNVPMHVYIAQVSCL